MDSEQRGLCEHTGTSFVYRKSQLTDGRGNPSRVADYIWKCQYSCSLAELLLKNTELKISEISLQSCLGSENYFYQVFKKKYGMSPLKYRKAFCAKNGGTEGTVAFSTKAPQKLF